MPGSNARQRARLHSTTPTSRAAIRPAVHAKSGRQPAGWRYANRPISWTPGGPATGRHRSDVSVSSYCTRYAAARTWPARRRGRPDQGASKQILVTDGTRIARPDFESPSPIVTVPAAAFQRTASSTVETTLNQMPQFAPGATGTSHRFTDGEATLDLRGLGPNSTLVLIDGRRLLPVNGDGYTDVNLIPPALIKASKS